MQLSYNEYPRNPTNSLQIKIILILIDTIRNDSWARVIDLTFAEHSFTKLLDKIDLNSPLCLQVDTLIILPPTTMKS